MNYIFSIIGGIVGFFLSAFALEGMGVSMFPGLPIAIGLGILSMIVIFKKLNGNKSLKESIADGVAYAKTTTEDISSIIDEKDSKFYAIAEQEMDDNIIDKGLWSQALVKAKGDENLRKVEYMKLRVKQLKKQK